MITQCPKCGEPSSLERPFMSAGEPVVRCAACGTVWNPLRDESDLRPALQMLPAVRAPTVRSPNVSDAVVIEHIGPGFRNPPPHRRIAKAESEPKDRSYLGIAGLIFGVVVMLAAGGVPLFSAVPGFASMAGLPEGVDSLAFRNVKSQTLYRGGATTLYVEGEVVNHSMIEMPLPAIKVTLKADDGRAVTSWLVEPSTPAVAAGGSIGFRSAFASPPEGATNISLSLAARENQIVGMR